MVLEIFKETFKEDLTSPKICALGYADSLNSWRNKHVQSVVWTLCLSSCEQKKNEHYCVCLVAKQGKVEIKINLHK